MLGANRPFLLAPRAPTSLCSSSGPPRGSDLPGFPGAHPADPSQVGECGPGSISRKALQMSTQASRATHAGVPSHSSLPGSHLGRTPGGGTKPLGSGRSGLGSPGGSHGAGQSILRPHLWVHSQPRRPGRGTGLPAAGLSATHPWAGEVTQVRAAGQGHLVAHSGCQGKSGSRFRWGKFHRSQSGGNRRACGCQPPAPLRGPPGVIGVTSGLKGPGRPAVSPPAWGLGGLGLLPLPGHLPFKPH